jgi:hypothetical protein
MNTDSFQFLSAQSTVGNPLWLLGAGAAASVVIATVTLMKFVKDRRDRTAKDQWESWHHERDEARALLMSIERIAHPIRERKFITVSKLESLDLDTLRTDAKRIANHPVPQQLIDLLLEVARKLGELSNLALSDDNATAPDSNEEQHDKAISQYECAGQLLDLTKNIRNELRVGDPTNQKRAGRSMRQRPLG